MWACAAAERRGRGPGSRVARRGVERCWCCGVVGGVSVKFW